MEIYIKPKYSKASNQMVLDSWSIVAEAKSDVYLCIGVSDNSFACLDEKTNKIYHVNDKLLMLTPMFDSFE